MTIEGVDPKDEHLQASEKLQESLKACNELVADLRSKLAANSNEPLDRDHDQFVASREQDG